MSATSGRADLAAFFCGFAVGYLKPKNTPEAALVWYLHGRSQWVGTKCRAASERVYCIL